MINRLMGRLGEPDPPRPPEDYCEIHARMDTYYVSRAVAERVLRDLGRAPRPEWIGFTDLSGAAVRIRGVLIDCVQECGGAHRAAQREFRRARRLEEKADRRPWEDGDWW